MTDQAAQQLPPANVKRRVVQEGWTLPKAVQREVFHSCPEQATLVFITLLPMQQISALHRATKGEWLAYLDGYYDAKGNPVITSLRVPEQVATTGNVDHIEWVDSPNHIGVIHSHHTLQCSFSGTDHQYINANHKLSVLVRTDPKDTQWGFNLTSELRQDVSCGVQLRDELPVKLYIAPVMEDADTWLEDALAKIKAPEPRVFVNGVTQRATQSETTVMYNRVVKDGYNNKVIAEIAKESGMPYLYVLRAIYAQLMGEQETAKKVEADGNAAGYCADVLGEFWYDANGDGFFREWE